MRKLSSYLTRSPNRLILGCIRNHPPTLSDRHNLQSSILPWEGFMNSALGAPEQRLSNDRRQCWRSWAVQGHRSSPSRLGVAWVMEAWI